MSRFVVRELEGYRINPTHPARSHSKTRPGLTVWVADETFNGREMRVWRYEEMQGTHRAVRVRRMRDAARAYAAELEASCS